MDIEKGHLFIGHESAETGDKAPVIVDGSDLTTHGVIVGMTGSDKTGVGITILEEALLNDVPSLIIDPKGDMGNLLLTFTKSFWTSPESDLKSHPGGQPRGDRLQELRAEALLAGRGNTGGFNKPGG